MCKYICCKLINCFTKRHKRKLKSTEDMMNSKVWFQWYSALETYPATREWMLVQTDKECFDSYYIARYDEGKKAWYGKDDKVLEEVWRWADIIYLISMPGDAWTGIKR